MKEKIEAAVWAVLYMIFVAGTFWVFLNWDLVTSWLRSLGYR